MSVDVGIYALAAQGVAVLFASSDLPEVLGVADRIVVMREGEIAGELLHEQADERRHWRLAMPGRPGSCLSKESMMSSVSTSGSGAPKSSFSFGRISRSFGMLVVFAVLFMACAIFVPNFATFINMKGLGLAISMSGMVACGMLFCLASGDFDLSVASVMPYAGVTTAVVINLTESLWIGVAAGLLLRIVCGLVNGFVIAKLKINALITTLATMQIVRGLAYIISDGKAVGIEVKASLPLVTLTGSVCLRQSGSPWRV